MSSKLRNSNLNFTNYNTVNKMLSLLRPIKEGSRFRPIICNTMLIRYPHPTLPSEVSVGETGHETSSFSRGPEIHSIIIHLNMQQA